MRKAFTVIEIIFVVTIVAILLAVAVPRMLPDLSFERGADAFASNLKYTQHLSLMDDRFDPANAQWHQTRWRMEIVAGADSWRYRIVKGVGANEEVAINPHDRGPLDITNEGGISICGTPLAGATNIAFDEIGRPAINAAWPPANQFAGMLNANCSIVVSKDADEISFVLHRETGYLSGQ